LIIQSYDQSNVETIFTAKRCLETNPKKDAFDRFVDPNCRDITPDFFHLAMTNMVGKLQRSFIIDVTSNVEVWNQPVSGYEVLNFEKITKEQAESAVFPNAGQSFYIDTAVDFVSVKMRMDYIGEGTSEFPFLSTKLVDKFIIPVTYEYVLGLDSKGEIVDGEWINDSKTNHPDFLWMPLGRPKMDSKVAGGIMFSDVVELLDKSRACL